MPNLIHYLDAYYMTQLYYYFSSKHKDVQFYYLHDFLVLQCIKLILLKIY